MKKNKKEEKAADYYAKNKEAIKEKSRNRYKNLSQEEKDKIKEYQNRFNIKKKRWKINNFCSLTSIKNYWKSTKI